MSEIELELLKFLVNWVGWMTFVYWFGRGIGWLVEHTE